MVEAGEACAAFHDKIMRNLSCKVIQVDGVWSFTYCKQANISEHKHMMAIYAMNYNFCRIHHTLRVTPAMEAGIANHVWTIEEIAALIA